MLKVGIGADHGGFEYKNKLVNDLKQLGYEVVDYGTNSSESVDYPEYSYPVAIDVSLKKIDRGIVICGTGIGVSIVANKAKGVRCALVNDVQVAKITREHNDSNMLAMGARVIDYNKCFEISKMWLETEFSNEKRHIDRIRKIGEIENAR